MSATRDEILSRARVRADQPTNSFPTDAEALPLIKEAGEETWYDLWAAGYPLRRTSTTFSGNGSSFYSINSGSPIMMVDGVFTNFAGEYAELPRADRFDPSLLLSPSSVGGQAIAYSFEIDPASGPGIVIWPQVATGTFLVRHVPEWPGFSSGADVWRGPARSDKLVVLRLAAMLLRKEGETADANAIDREYEELLTKVVRLASAMDRNPPVIRDVGVLRRDPFDYPVGRDVGY